MKKKITTALRIAQEEKISEETIERIDVSVENLKNGKVSKIIDLTDFEDTKCEKGK